MTEKKRIGNPTPLTGPAADQEMRRLTRRGFVTGAVAAMAGLGGWRLLTTAPLDDGIPWPLRRALRFNAGVAEALGAPAGLAPTFAADRVHGDARVNGLVGLSNAVDSDAWRLMVEGHGPTRSLRLADIQRLPRTEMITEFKCVEGWSQVMHFGGVRFRDFVEHLGLATRDYVYLATPDENYYVGLDIASALHSQTLLCDTMNWQPLTREHGAPLRLYLPVKYGYKSLKRIGLIRFQNERPADYWADRGYDWYAGL